jgi:cell division protein FtsB
MFRIYLVLFILHLGLIFQGCSALEYLDGSSKEKIKGLEATQEEMSNETEKLKIENANLKQQINLLSEENNAVRVETASKLEKMTDENKLLQSQLKKLREENQKISKENKNLYKNVADLRLNYKIFPSKMSSPQDIVPVSGKDIKKFKIKVLTGDGDYTSAKKMEKRLRDMGYEIQLIDKSPRSNFIHNTVYFAPKFQSEAKQLASRLGSNTIFKPLTWSSVFDLIVVTGSNP